MPKRAPLHPVLRFIYLLLRIISWLGVYVFYRRRLVFGREHLQFDGPAIVVVNHPSTLMDVLNPCVHIPHELFFLANYGLFKHPVSNWLLTRLYCIPVKRKEDVAAGEERNNDAAFEQSFGHMVKKGLLFIAAEGVSWMERWVRPFKSGAARIAFGAEMRHNWSLDVKFLPIGLSYSAPNLFRSKVMVHFGRPIPASLWRQQAESDIEKAIDDCTLELQQRVRALVLDTRDEPGQVFVENLEIFMQDRFPTEASTLAYFDYRKDLIEQNLDQIALRGELAGYFDGLAAAGIHHTGLTRSAGETAFRRWWSGLLALILGCPFFLAGYLFWFLPCYLPWLLAKKMNLYVGYDSNVKMLAGLFTFPLALWALYHLAATCHIAGWAAVLAMVALGYIAEQYQDLALRWKQLNRAIQWKKSQPQQWKNLIEKANAIHKMIHRPTERMQS